MTDGTQDTLAVHIADAERMMAQGKPVAAMTVRALVDAIQDRARREPTDEQWAAYAEAERLHNLDDVAAEFGIDLTDNTKEN